MGVRPLGAVDHVNDLVRLERERIVASDSLVPDLHDFAGPGEIDAGDDLTVA